MRCAVGHFWTVPGRKGSLLGTKNPPVKYMDDVKTWNGVMTSWHGNALRITGLLWGDPPVTAAFLSQMDSNVELWYFVVVSLSKLLDKQSSWWWFETSWRFCDLTVVEYQKCSRLWYSYLPGLLLLTWFKPMLCKDVITYLTKFRLTIASFLSVCRLKFCTEHGNISHIKTMYDQNRYYGPTGIPL